MEEDFGSPQRAINPVPQIPAEYDDLYMQRGSDANQRDFSQDINKRMKMPNRLSVDGQNLHDLEVENMRAQGSSSQIAAAGMAVPDKITLTGAVNRGALDDQYGFMNTLGLENADYVNITTPPRVLTVDERFPVIEDSVELSSTPSKSMADETANDTRTVDLELSAQRLNKQLALPSKDVQDVLMQRLHILEMREQQRQRREMIVYPVVAVYFTYKLMSWLMNR